jgi:hypothetical protein
MSKPRYDPLSAGLPRHFAVTVYETRNSGTARDSMGSWLVHVQATHIANPQAQVSAIRLVSLISLKCVAGAPKHLHHLRLLCWLDTKLPLDQPAALCARDSERPTRHSTRHRK